MGAKPSIVKAAGRGDIARVQHLVLLKPHYMLPDKAKKGSSQGSLSADSTARGTTGAEARKDRAEAEGARRMDSTPQSSA